MTAAQLTEQVQEIAENVYRVRMTAQQELIRQEMTLLKQTEILAVNTAILKGVFAVEKTRNPEPEKEVFKIDHMP